MRSHRIAINLPQPLHDFVRKIAERRGIPATAAIVSVIGEYMDQASAMAAGPKSKTTGETNAKRFSD